MKYDEVPAGRYTALATRARTQESKAKKTPYIEVEFYIPDLDVHMRWQGYLTEKTINRTMETMILLDWNDDQTFGEGSINTKKPVQLTITREIGLDGKERPRVQWVNDASRSKFDGLAPQELNTALGGVNLKAAMQAARQRMGVTHQQPPVLPRHEPTFPGDKESDIPW